MSDSTRIGSTSHQKLKRKFISLKTQVEAFFQEGTYSAKRSACNRMKRIPEEDGENYESESSQAIRYDPSKLTKP